MAEIIWGLLGPEVLPSLRRVRTLGLNASVRLFNDLAVPGIGGVWFGKQLMLATLGVAIAEKARSAGKNLQNIATANAIEALACWLALKGNGWKPDPRLRGNTKLQGRGDDFRFSRVQDRNFYVTQPMRMATVQAMPALGLVHSESHRFNAFACSEAGVQFVEHACEPYRPYRRSVIDHLTHWASGAEDRVDTDAVRNALSPLEPLPQHARDLLRERLLQGGRETEGAKSRRVNALAWMGQLRSARPAKVTWDDKPAAISDQHWHDMAAGARFFAARDSAIGVLDALEAHIGNSGSGCSFSLQTPVPESLLPLLSNLKKVARAFLDTEHADKDANAFCRECTSHDIVAILRSLVTRDGHVLRLDGYDVRPGPAFRGNPLAQEAADDEVIDSPAGNALPLPEGISYRMSNLYLLNLDLHGELQQWLDRGAEGRE